MKPEVFLSYFLRDPLIGSYFLRGNYLFDDKKSKTFSDAGRNKEHDLEVLWSEASASYDADRITNKVGAIQSRWANDYQTKEAFLLFFIDLVSSGVGKDIIYELKRLDKSVGSAHKKEFYKTFVKHIDNQRGIQAAIEKLSIPKYDTSVRHLFQSDDLETIRTKSARSKELTKLVSKVFPEIKTFIEITYLKPKYSYNLDKVDSNEDGEITHPFVWCGDNTKLAELILFLVANGWLKANERIESKKNLAIAISNIFLLKRGESIKNMSPSTFESYFKGLELDDINTMVVDEIYTLKSTKMKVDKKKAPFRNIDSRRDKIK